MTSYAVGLAICYSELFVAIRSLDGSRVLVLTQDGALLRSWSVRGTVRAIAAAGPTVFVASEEGVECFSRHGARIHAWPVSFDAGLPEWLAANDDRLAASVWEAGEVRVFSHEGLARFCLKASGSHAPAFCESELFVLQMRENARGEDVHVYAASDGTFLRRIWCADSVWTRIAVSGDGVLALVATQVLPYQRVYCTVNPDGHQTCKVRVHTSAPCTGVVFSNGNLYILDGMSSISSTPIGSANCELVVKLDKV
jgi:hypothetical protein